MSETPSSPSPSPAGLVRRLAPALVAGVGYAAAAVFAGLLIHAVIAGFTWHKYHADYAIYANMLWNSAHGEPFRYFVTLNYLKVHLSFSLLLLAPLFWVFDHPFLLCGVQLGCLFGGAALLHRAARRHGLPHAMAAALLFFMVGYRFTQNVQVHAFHGVSLYFLLLPWLYYCLCFRKPWAVLPWLVILGLREDAALVTLPLLLYVAVRDRWKTGYVLAALALLYSACAVFVLYPWINGASLAESRHREMSTVLGGGLQVAEWLHSRQPGLVLVALPLLALAGRRLPLALLPGATALLQALCSGWRNQFVLETHYSAAVMAGLATGLLEAAGRAPGWMIARALALIAVVAGVHAWKGVIRGGPRPDHRLLSISEPGRDTLRAARQVPQDGILLCTGDVEEYFAHRRDLLVYRKADLDLRTFDYVFATEDELQPLQRGELRAQLEAGALGIRFHQHGCFLLERGADASRNHLLLHQP